MITFIGGAVAAVGAVVVSAVVLLGVWAAFTAYSDRLRRQGAALEREWQRNRMRAAAWWFSEDDSTMRLLMDLGQMEIWQAREAWRKRRAGAAEEQ